MGATQTTPLAAGTVVRAHRFSEGKSIGIRKGVVLGFFADGDPSSGYLVFFYGLGPAAKNTGLCFSREITVIGDLADLSEAVLHKIDRRIGHFGDGFAVRLAASTLRLRKRAIRLGR